MALTVTSVTPTVSTANTTSYASASFTPAASDLLVVIVVKNGNTANGSLASSVGGQSFARLNGGHSVANIEAFVANVQSTNVAQTVTYTTGSATACNIWIARVAGLPAGAAGAAAIRQSAVGAESGTTTTVTLAQAPLAASACIGGITNSSNPATVTQPASWTEDTDTGIGTPATGLEGAHRVGETSASIVWTTNTTTAEGIVVEVDARWLGTSSTTNANDTSAASGSKGNSGTAASTNANDTSAASGTFTGSGITGTLAYTNANDTSAASGSKGNSGSLARTNANDTSAASGTSTPPTFTGTLARTNNNDTSAASGTFTPPTITGTSSTTNANDTMVGVGNVPGAVVPPAVTPPQPGGRGPGSLLPSRARDDDEILLIL